MGLPERIVEWLGRCLLPVAAFLMCVASPLGVVAIAQSPDQGVATTNPMWVKVCSKPQAGATGGAGSICLDAHHERLDRQTGMVLVSVAIRRLPNFDDPLLMVMVPLGMAIKPGLELKFDDSADAIRVDYSTCHFAGCTAETVATDELISKMKSGRKMTVTAVSQVGRSLLFPVPLDGFTKAYTGTPIDMEMYKANRRELIRRLREPLYSQDQLRSTASAMR